MKWDFTHIAELEPVVQKALPSAQIAKNQIDDKYLAIYYNDIHAFLKDFPNFRTMVSNECEKANLNYDKLIYKLEDANITILIKYIMENFLRKSTYDIVVNPMNNKLFDSYDDSVRKFENVIMTCFSKISDYDGEFGKAVDYMTTCIDAWFLA